MFKGIPCTKSVVLPMASLWDFARRINISLFNHLYIDICDKFLDTPIDQCSLVGLYRSLVENQSHAMIYFYTMIILKDKVSIGYCEVKFFYIPFHISLWNYKLYKKKGGRKKFAQFSFMQHLVYSIIKFCTSVWNIKRMKMEHKLKEFVITHDR